MNVNISGLDLVVFVGGVLTEFMSAFFVVFWENN